MDAGGLRFRRARPADAAALTALMHASTAYAGDYASILRGYAVTVGQIERDVVHLAEDGANAIVGFYSLTVEDEPELDLMFVADHGQGTGVGRALFDHMRGEARSRGIASVTIVSHPPSLGFYERMGATRVGTKPPTPNAGWERPILRLDI